MCDCKNNEIEVYIEVCRDIDSLPQYANLFDAGMDIMAAEEVIIDPECTTIIPTGIKVAIPEGYEIQVRPRSGISAKTPLKISNSPGTIDTGYRGEIGVIMYNSSRKKDYKIHELNTKGEEGSFRIKKGDRIAQLVLQKVPRIKWVQTTSVDNIGINRNGGFGSTGVK